MPPAGQANDDPRLGSAVGNYRLAEVIGRGGMGTVYRADHSWLDRSVAIKILHEQFLSDPQHTAQFLREAQAASRIKHANIVEVSDFGELSDGNVYFVMELLDGRSLDDVITEEAPLSALRAINIMNQIARALDAVHAHNMLHGDLKPENVLLVPRAGTRQVVRHGHETPEGTYDFVKLLDFGTARLIQAVHEGEGRITGTPFYMAPELIKGKPHDRRVDVYAAGVMLYEMMTGSLPFDGQTTIMVLQQHVYAEPVAPREVVARERMHEITHEMEQTILIAMAKDPDQRFGSMEALRKALAGCYAGERYVDPSPQVAQQRATSEVERRREVDPPGPLPPSKSVEDKLSSLFGAWSRRVTEKRPTQQTLDTNDLLSESRGDLLRRALERELGAPPEPPAPESPGAGVLKTLQGYRFRAANPGPKKTR